jgi:hypothetical protein
MSETPEAIAQQIAELEVSLAQPLPEAVRRLVEQQLVALHQQVRVIDLHGAQTGDVTVGDVAGRDVHKGTQGTTDLSGTLYGAAVGVNLGTIHVSHGASAPAPAGGSADSEQIVAQRERLAAHRATLAHYLGQLATVGSANARPEVSAGIREARAGIRRTKEALRRWGVAVEDLLDDEPPAGR